MRHFLITCCLCLSAFATKTQLRPPGVGLGRRATLGKAAAVGASALTAAACPGAAQAVITQDSQWPLWLALPVAPYSRRKTIRREVGPGVWAFDQLIGIYYVHVPIRMTVVRLESGGLFVYAPVAPTKECLSLLQPLIDAHGPIRYIVLPSVAVEHKVNAGPFARAFPDAEFYAVDQQYSFPVPLPSLFLGLPRWTKPLPRSSEGLGMWGGELDHEVCWVAGPGSRATRPGSRATCQPPAPFAWDLQREPMHPHVPGWQASPPRDPCRLCASSVVPLSVAGAHCQAWAGLLLPRRCLHTQAFENLAPLRRAPRRHPRAAADPHQRSRVHACAALPRKRRPA